MNNNYTMRDRIKVLGIVVSDLIHYIRESKSLAVMQILWTRIIWDNVDDPKDVHYGNYYQHCKWLHQHGYV